MAADSISRDTAGRLALAGLRVFVVDDDEDIRRALSAVLESEGATVTTFASSAAALSHLDQQRPDVMLVDLSMPIVNGFEFVQQLRLRSPERGGRVPAAALTGYISGEDRRRALGAGFQAFLNKPVEADELVETVRSVVREHYAS